MFFSYLKTAVRSIRSQKVLSTINILGLSIGLACFSLFQLYVIHEFSYDQFHKKADNLYRVYRWNNGINGQEPSGDTYLPMPMGPAFKEEFPEVVRSVRMREDWGDEFIRIDGIVSLKGIAFADPQFFDMFDFPIKYGNHQTPLNEISSVVLTEETALELFGEANPVGRTMEIKIDDAFVSFTVTAIAEDLPANSSITFDILGNFEFMANHTVFGKRCLDNWFRSSFKVFVELRDGSGLAYANNHTHERLIAFWKKYFPDSEAEMRSTGAWSGEGTPLSYGLQPLKSLHTDTRLGWNAVDPKNIWTLLAIATGVLLIACINFTTLAIGRSAGRAREVGVRKVIGGNRKQLASQFLLEALVLACISSGIGFALAQMLLPHFNALSGRELAFSLDTYPEVGYLMVGMTILVGLLAGSYPAFVLSGFNPVEVLKSKIRLGGSNLFTKALVTFQFVLSIGLIASTLIIIKQLDFMRTSNPGFNKEQVIVVDASGMESESIYPLFKQLLQSTPQIIGIAGAELGLGEGTGWSQSGFEYKGVHKDVYEYFIDHDYMEVMGMQLISGRNFDPRIAADTQYSVIANEAMVRDFGWTIESAIGQKLDGYYDDSTAQMPVVIGVVKDFHFRPLSEEVSPQMFHQFADYVPYKYFVRTKAGEPTEALAAMEKTWKSIAPGYPLRYSFLDENLDRFYHAEKRLSKIIGWAGGISIFLACLGLFGLAALAAANRTKEIGIRKVCGASLMSITRLLSTGFLKLVLIALIIATPLAWILMKGWLADFAYRIEIPVWIFALAGFGATLIAFVTVCFQSVKAAMTSPVTSLRSE